MMVNYFTLLYMIFACSKVVFYTVRVNSWHGKHLKGKGKGIWAQRRRGTPAPLPPSSHALALLSAQESPFFFPLQMPAI